MAYSAKSKFSVFKVDAGAKGTVAKVWHMWSIHDTADRHVGWVTMFPYDSSLPVVHSYTILLAPGYTLSAHKAKLLRMLWIHIFNRKGQTECGSVFWFRIPVSQRGLIELRHNLRLLQALWLVAARWWGCSGKALLHTKISRSEALQHHLLLFQLFLATGARLER